jgi:hypothetical protein
MDGAAWDWDFDNDGEPDSTERNPSYLYVKPGVYMVSLTVCWKSKKLPERDPITNPLFEFWI